MKRRLIHVGIVYMVFHLLYCFPSFAEDWEVYVPDVEESQESFEPVTGYIDPDDYDDFGIASPSDAVIVYNEVVPLGTHVPHDSSISTSVVQYMSDVLPKLGNTSYVLFRSGQYSYRMVYSDDLELDNGVITSPYVSYILYDTREYEWTAGTEGSFTLRTNGYIVYSDLGEYPVLARESIYVWGLLFLGMVFFLFTIYRSFFSLGRMKI